MNKHRNAHRSRILRILRLKAQIAEKRAAKSLETPLEIFVPQRAISHASSPRSVSIHR